MKKWMLLCGALMICVLLGRMEEPALTADAGADIAAETKYVALTFDDGPKRGTTDVLLDGLRERGVSATFFLIGSQMAANRDLVARMAAEGHQVGNHTWSHTRLQGAGEAAIGAELGRTDELLTAGDELYLLDPESSRAGIYIGHKMTLKQALQGLLLKSGNDAAYMIAAQIGHKMDESLTGQAAIDLFCRKMTEKAKELGCTNTTFLNPDGIDKNGHQTTANDLLKISLYALKHPLIAEIVATEKVTTTFASGQTKTWQNSNKLIQSDSKYTYDGTCGLKTGTTDAAGNCLISCATRDGRTVLCILLGAKTDAIRYEESIELLNLGFW